MKGKRFTLRTFVLMMMISWMLTGFWHPASAAGTPSSPANTSLSAGEVSPRDGGSCIPGPMSAASDQVTATTDTYITQEPAAPTSSSPAASSSSTRNFSPRTAIELTPGVPVEGYLSPDDPACASMYYKITVTKTQKITALLLVPPGLDYSMYMESTASFRHKGPYDQLSYVAQPGTYYLRVTVGHTAGSLSQPFNLRIMLSDKFDDYERYSDDSSATEAYYWGTTVQTIDSRYDEDWKMFGMDYPGTLTVRLDNPSSKGVYKAEIWDWDDNVIATVKQNEPTTLRLPVTSYFVRVYAPTKYDPDVPYTLTMDTKYDPRPVCGWDEERPWEWVCTWP